MEDNSKLDDLITQVGTGKWNLLYFFGAAIWDMMLPPQALSIVYLAPTVNHTCLPPPDQNVSHISEDSCSYFRSTSEGLREEPCQEWLYDDSVFSSTLTSEFGLVCGKSYLRATYHSLYNISKIIGNIFSGYAADRYGRKLVVVVLLVLYASTAISISFVSNFYAVMCFRFMLGLTATHTFYIMGMEVCETKYRSVVGIVMALPWAFGTMMWGGAGYLVRDWRWLQLLVSLPMLLVLPVLLLIDESPRWLIVNHKNEQAIKVLKRACRLNGTSLPPDQELRSIINDIQLEREEAIKKTQRISHLREDTGKGRCAFSWPDLLKSRKMRIVTATMGLNYFISALVYSGLNLSGTTYSTDPFIYMVLSGLMEIPGYTITAPIIKRFGRKMPTIIGFIFCGIVILSVTFIPSDVSWLVMTFALLGKLTISGSFMILFVLGAELFPTEVRLQGTAVTIITSNVAGSLTPYIVDYLSPLVPWLPSVIFGVSSFVASLVLLPVPETLGKPLPDIVEDLEGLWRKKNRRMDVDAEDNTQTEKLKIET